MEKKKSPNPTPAKATPKKKSKRQNPKAKSFDKSTQVRNICLVHVKHRIVTAVNSWIQSLNVDPESIAEDDNEAYFDMIQDLYEQLKRHIQDDQLRLLKIKQVELELKASLVFTMAATYMNICKLPGFADFFQNLAKSSVSLVFSLGSGVDLSSLKSISYHFLRSYEIFQLHGNNTDFLNHICPIQCTNGNSLLHPNHKGHY